MMFGWFSLLMMLISRMMRVTSDTSLKIPLTYLMATFVLVCLSNARYTFPKRPVPRGFIRLYLDPSSH
jgi:hypothetical protein